MFNRNNRQFSLNQLQNMPQGHLHSKISFLKSLLTQQNPQLLDMKSKMYKMSYTIKNIGVHGQQIGITSKRTPLRPKQAALIKDSKQKTEQNLNNLFQKKYLPQNSFYSHPLVPVHKLKTQTQNQRYSQNRNDLLITSSNLSNLNSNDFTRNNAMATADQYLLKRLKNFKSKHNILKTSPNQKHSQSNKQKEFKNRVSSEKQLKTSSQQKSKILMTKAKKSFARLLSQCRPTSLYHNIIVQRALQPNQPPQLIPLQNQHNSLFRRILKIQENSKNVEANSISRQKHRSLSRGSQGSVGILKRYSSIIKSGKYEK